VRAASRRANRQCRRQRAEPLLQRGQALVAPVPGVVVQLDKAAAIEDCADSRDRRRAPVDHFGDRLEHLGHPGRIAAGGLLVALAGMLACRRAGRLRVLRPPGVRARAHASLVEAQQWHDRQAHLGIPDRRSPGFFPAPPGRLADGDRRPDPDHLRQLPGAARDDRPGRGHRPGRQHLRGRVHQRCPGLPPGRHPGRGRDLAGPRRAVRLAGLRPGPDAPREQTWPSSTCPSRTRPWPASRTSASPPAGRPCTARRPPDAGPPGDGQPGRRGPAAVGVRRLVRCRDRVQRRHRDHRDRLPRHVFHPVAAGQRLRRCRSTRLRPSASCSARSAAADRPYRRAMAGPLQPARYTRLSVWPPFSR
jgi:hypothetical protein